jgi:GxxExxY protein
MPYDKEVEGKDLLTEAIIGAAIEVHKHLGPGLLESTYEQCLCWELRDAGLKFIRQTMIPINYKGDSTGGVYKPDLVVEDRVMIEIKAVDRLASIHEAFPPKSSVVLGVLGASVSSASMFQIPRTLFADQRRSHIETEVRCWTATVSSFAVMDSWCCGSSSA